MDWRRLNVIYGVMLWVLVVSVGISDSQSDGDKPRYDVIVATNIMVPMRDGVKLATDVYMPARDGVPAPGKFPVLVSRTPYGKDPAPARRMLPAISPSSAMWSWCRIAAGVTTRKVHSISTLTRARTATTRWNGPRSNPGPTARWGTYGGSYLAQAQNALAVLRPPHLAAMFVMVGTSNYFDEGAYRGGAFTLLHNLVYPLILSSTSQEAGRDPALKAAMLQEGHEQIGGWLRAYPFRPNASPLAPRSGESALVSRLRRPSLL